MNFSNFEVILPVIISFAISAILCPFFIPFLKKLKYGQFIREEGPQAHQKKSGTPTMGGIVVIVSIILTSFFYLKDFSKIAPILFVTIGFGIIGFIDDYIKVVKKRNLGLRAWQKLLGQTIITVAFGIYFMYFSDLGTSMLIPFSGGNYIDASYLYWPIMFIAMLGTVNGSNFTDGLDGLESSVTAVIAAFLSVAAIIAGSNITPITGAVLGSLLGYLLFNVYPAKIFMGDTGSLALGGFVASTAYMLKMPLFIIIIAAIYLIEVLSVILQVGYFKLTHGKRIFKMAPIHHHFELSGWSETRIVAVFSIITIILCFVALMGIA